jgi:hypothetical protein
MLGPGSAGGLLAPGGDHQLAVFEGDVVLAVTVTLLLLVAAAPAIDIEVPFAPVELRAVELVGPD